MIQNAIAFDTEFNKNKEILSLGVFNDNIHKDIFFKNKVDKYSYKIHKIKESFLSQFEKFNPNDINFLFDYKYLICFDCFMDLYVLKIKRINSLFNDLRIIDIKDTLKYTDKKDLSIIKMAQILNINVQEHVASDDAKITYLYTEYILELLSNKYSTEEALDIMSKISRDAKNYESWYIEQEYYTFFNNLSKLI